MGEQLGIEARNARSVFRLPSFASTSDLEIVPEPDGPLCPHLYKQLTLSQAEGHPTVRIFKEACSGAEVVCEVCSGTSATCIGWTGAKGQFVRVRFQKSEGWVGWKNVVQDPMVGSRQVSSRATNFFTALFACNGTEVC